MDDHHHLCPTLKSDTHNIRGVSHLTCAMHTGSVFVMPPAPSESAITEAQATDTQPELIGSKEARKLLGVDNSTLTRWVSTGRIKPAGRIGSGPRGAFAFWRADIEKLAPPRCPTCGQVERGRPE